MKQMSVKVYIVLLAILAILSSNMYLPGIPIIQGEFHASLHIIQMTISYYMLGLALGMLFYGPLSDHYGRKPILLLALLIYMVGVGISAVSYNIQLFVVSRLLQALGAAGPLAIWQALAVDTYKERSAKMIATGFIAIGFVPALSPFIGSYCIAHLGWRSLFLALMLYGGVLFVGTLLCVQNHPQPTPDHDRGKWLTSALLRYRQLLLSSDFILFVVFTSFMYSMIYVFMAQTPSLLHDLSYSTKAIGLFFIPISIAFIAGSMLTRRLLGNSSNEKWILILGASFYVIGLLLQLLLQLSLSHMNWLALIAPFSLMTIGTGTMLPFAVSRAMAIFTTISGSSAAMMGASQNLFAFALSAIGALLSPLKDLGLTISLIALALLVLFLNGLVQRKLR